MNTATLSRHAAGPARSGYGFRTVARMEWHKLRTVRFTWVGEFLDALTRVARGATVLDPQVIAQLRPGSAGTAPWRR